MTYEPGETADADSGLLTGSRLVAGCIAVVLLAGFGGLVWYGWQAGNTGEGVVPLVQAPDGPWRERPEDRGGMEVPFSDSTVFDVLDPDSAPERVEQLLPPAEEPMDISPETALSDAGEGAVESLLEEDAPSQNEQEEAPASEPVIAEMPVQRIEEAPGPMPAGVPGAPAQPAPDNESREPQPAQKPPQEQTQTATVRAAVPSGDYRVQLGSLRSEAAAQTEWQRLQGRFSNQLGGLGLKTERVDIAGRGSFWRIQAGPLDEAGARAICDALKQRNPGGCIVIRE